MPKSNPPKKAHYIIPGRKDTADKRSTTGWLNVVFKSLDENLYHTQSKAFNTFFKLIYSKLKNIKNNEQKYNYKKPHIMKENVLNPYSLRTIQEKKNQDSIGNEGYSKELLQ